MKINQNSFKNLFLLFLLFLSVPSIMAQKNDERVTLQVNNVSVESFLKAIEAQTDYTFLYRKDIVNVSEKVTANYTNVLLQKVLKEKLNPLNISFKFKDKTIVLSKKKVKAKKKGRLVTFSGQILDESNLPIIGATVIVKGTSNGGVTDYDGNFKLKANIGDKVEIAYVGMETLTRPVSSKFMKIVMRSSSVSLEEVVVTGYQKINRKMFTGSASKINADETILKGAADVTSSLQGKVAGVQISNVSSTFGSSPVLTIRGNSSINGSNKPLWVVDGVVLEDLVNVSADDLTSGNLSTLLSSGVAGLNPEDIKSFEILKDVSATSLYGAQAMNGVIVITTKQGKKNKLNINYTGSVLVKERPNYNQFDIMNSVDEMSVYKELYNKGWIDVTTVARSENYGALGKMFNEITLGNINWGPNGSLNEGFLSKYANSNTDWFDLLFHNSVVNQHSLSISGGGERSTFYASMSYYDDNGLAVAADKVKRYTASLRGNFDVSDKLSLGLKLSTNIRDQRVPGTKDRSFDAISGEFTRDFDINPFNYVLNTSRSMRAYDDNGDLEYFRRSYTDFNIIHELNNNFVDLTVKDISSQVDVEYKPIKPLSIRGTFQYRVASTLREHKINETSNQAEAYRADYSQAIIDANRYLFRNKDLPTANPYSILPEGGFYNASETNLTHSYFRATADYSPKIHLDHILNVFAGFEVNLVKRKSSANDGWGYMWNKGGVVSTHPDVMKYLRAQGQTYFNYNETTDKRISSFVNSAYSYKGKYIFNAGFRYDGSNQLGRTKTARYLPSWNVSGAWNMQEEAFMQPYRDVISMLKPKISYGYNGIMGPSSSAELTIYAQQSLRPTDNEIFNEITSLQNDDLTWEKMYELNLGLEFALFHNRIMADIAHYRRRSIDLIDYVTTSGIGGESIKYGNIGNMDSYGFEIAINTVNIKTKDFSWNTNLNVNFHKSEITKLNNFSRMSTAVSNLGTALLGFPQRGLFSFRFAGLDNQGIPTFYGENNEIVQDMNLQSRDNVENILKYEGPLEPTSYGGLTNSFSYKNWSLSVGLVYKYGNKIRLDDEFYPTYNDYTAFPKDLKNRWIMPGDQTKTTIPAILDKRTYKNIESMQTYQMYNKSTERVADGDFVRLKDVSLKYSFPKQWLKKTAIKNANLSFQATNLCLLYSDSKLHGIDPEFYLSGGVSTPVSRTYTFTLNLGF